MLISISNQNASFGIYTGRVTGFTAEGVTVAGFTGPHDVIASRALLAGRRIGDVITYYARPIAGETRAVIVRLA